MFIFNEETGKLDIQKMRTNGSLPTDAYKFFDDALVKVAKQELTLVQDLNEYGLVDNSLTLGDTIVSYDKVSDMSPAEVSMDGITRSQNGALSFTEAGVPVPVFRKDFSLTERQIQATSRLSTTGIEIATRVVSESINTTCLNGYGRTVDSFQLYGLKNQPNVNTVTISNAWGGGSETPLANIESMIQQLQNDGYGFAENSCVLYVSPDNWGYIDQDYSTTKGEKTFKERFEAYAPIRKVQLGTGLADGELLLVEMRSDVIELKVAQDLTFFEQPKTDAMISNFTVLGAMALVVKSDSNGNSGVCYATGA